MLRDILVDIDQHLSKRLNDDLDETITTFSIFSFGSFYHGLRDTLEVSCNDFEGQKDADRQKVEHVMDCSSSKGSFELVTITKLTHGHNSVGDRSSNIGSHDHVDRIINVDGAGTNQRYNNRGGGRRGLEAHGTENTNHEASDGIHIVSKEPTSGT